MTARPDLETVKAAMLDAVVAATWRHDPREVVGTDALICRERYVGRWPGDAGLTVSHEEARALTVRRYGHLFEHIDADKLAATVLEWFAAHYEPSPGSAAAAMYYEARRVA